MVANTTALVSSPVASYPITVSGAADLNYTIGFVGVDLTVTAAPLTVTAEAKAKIYGAAVPALTWTIAGFVNGDDEDDLDTPVVANTTALVSSPVASYPITVSGATDVNYAITFVGADLTVTAASLTVTAAAKTKVYGGVVPALTWTITGFVNGDDETDLDTPVVPNTTTLASSPVASYPITVSGAADLNYTIGFVGADLTVTAAPLTVTAEAKAKIYGAAVPALTWTISGFVNDDDETDLDTPVVVNTTALASSPVASYPITVSGATDANYAITFVAVDLTVTAAPLTVTAEAKLKVYGAILPVLSWTITGFVNDDDDTDLDSPVVATTTATANSVVGGYPITVTGAADLNYAIGLVGADLTVTQAPLTITAEPKSRVFGQANPALTWTYAGLVAGDSGAGFDPAISATTTALVGSPLGTYPITLSGTLTNYAITFVPSTLTVYVLDVSAVTVVGRYSGGVTPTVTVGGNPALQALGVFSGSATVPGPGTHAVPVTVTSDPVSNPGNAATVIITVEEIDIPLGGG